MRLYDETCLALCEGQYLDIAASVSNELMSVEGYFDMIGRKTAALIAASIEAGALLATDDETVIARYRGFGWALGLAFQVNDDLLGIWGAERATGKEASDVAHRKQTLPVIYAHETRRPRGPGAAAGALRRAGPDARGGRRGRRDPRADRRPRVHPRAGPPLPRRGPRRARRRRRARGRPPGRGSSRSSSSAITA